jgi:hypothetical protein
MGLVLVARLLQLGDALHTSRTICIYPATAAAATFNTVDIPVGWMYSGFKVWVKTTASSGTSPTLDVKIEEAIRAPGTATAGQNCNGSYEYQDYAAFTQINGNTERMLSVAGSGEEEYVVSAGTLAAATIRNGPIPEIFRCRCVIAGTNPSFTVQIVVKLIP